MEKKIVPGDYVAPDAAAIELNVDDKDNPRLKVNVPASKLFIELTRTDPPVLIVVVRADNIIAAKGALSHAHDILMVAEPHLVKKTELTSGVQKTMKKIAEGVH